MIFKVKNLLQEVSNFSSTNLDEIEEFRIKYLSKKDGVVTNFFKEFRNIPKEYKKEYGQVLNQLKSLVEKKIEIQKNIANKKAPKKEDIDLTLPGDSQNLGTRHPISIVKNEIIEIFTRLGFTIAEGPEIENDWHNFSALNFPDEHPARDMQDTFFTEIKPDVLLRTHTSNGQVRVMANEKPPIRIIVPGRVFRNEAVSARAHCIFHQIEGLFIDENVSFADLKQTLVYFAKEFFGENTKTRLRPSYFPFTEPSAEMDISCSLCEGKGCKVCKQTGWLEILGCGMVDPNVLESSNIDSKKYTGFAFGMGIERIAMLKFGVNDLRMYFENDIRFLRQFQEI